MIPNCIVNIADEAAQQHDGYERRDGKMRRQKPHEQHKRRKVKQRVGCREEPRPVFPETYSIKPLGHDLPCGRQFFGSRTGMTIRRFDEDRLAIAGVRILAHGLVLIFFLNAGLDSKPRAKKR